MPERRRVARVMVPWHLQGRVLASQAVRILDLSPAGIRIQHVEPMRPGASCVLDVPSPLGPLRLTARVVWSVVRGAEQTPEGERRLHYQSGLSFIGLTGDQQAVLADALEKINTTGGANDRKLPR